MYLPEITEAQKKSVKSRLLSAIELIQICIGEMDDPDLETTALGSENLKIASGIIQSDVQFLDSRK